MKNSKGKLPERKTGSFFDDSSAALQTEKMYDTMEAEQGMEKYTWLYRGKNAEASKAD